MSTDFEVAFTKDKPSNAVVVDAYVRIICGTVVPTEITQLITYFLPKSYRIFAAGWNHYGEFALEHKAALRTFRPLEVFESLCDDVLDVYAGWKRFCIRNVFNDIYCVGRNVDKDLGIQTTETEIDAFQRMTPIPNEPFYTMFTGNFAFHSFFLCSSHNLYAIGQNKSSQCGFEYVDIKSADENDSNDDEKNESNNDTEQKQHDYAPKLLGSCLQIFHGQNIQKICCGDNFSIFLTINGDLFSCGSNRYGSCGFPIKPSEPDAIHDVITSPTPIQVPQNVKMADVHCGGRHVMCIGRDGNVWCFGQNMFHQLGFTEKRLESRDGGGYRLLQQAQDVGIPAINPFFEDKGIVDMICGFSHNIAIDGKGNAYVFGRNHKGQCGVFHQGDFDVFETISTPKLFQEIMPDVWIQSGSAGYEHSVLLSTDNRLIGFGGNSEHEICNSSRLIIAPYFMDKSEIGIDENQIIERVICGIDTTVIIWNCL